MKKKRNSIVNLWFEKFVRHCRQDTSQETANNFEFSLLRLGKSVIFILN